MILQLLAGVGIEKETEKKPHQVAALIAKAAPDIVAMQETYSSGPWRKEKLGYHLQLRGAHLSIFSRHPIVADFSVGGDFNSMSHLDYTEKAAEQYDEQVIAWPTSQVMTQAGFEDSYRAVNPMVDRAKDSTWSPEFPDQEQDRIDFIYSRSKTLKPERAWVTKKWEPFFPSDHAALFTTLTQKH